MPRAKPADKGGKVTAVEWTWRGDQNNWVAYDKDMNLTLETEHSKGSKKIKIDKERFVDLSLNRDEVAKKL
jgi:hypothetical protein